MFRCPSCHAQTIYFRAWLLSSRRRPIKCPACGCECRPDFARLRWPFGLCLIAGIVFFSTNAYAQSLPEPSLVVAFAILISNVVLIGSGVWLVIATINLPLRKR